MRRLLAPFPLAAAVLAVAPAAAPAARLAFERQPLEETGALPASPLVADVTGDGVLDVVTPNADAGTVSILVGRGDGSLAPRLDVAAGPTPVAVTSGELRWGVGRVDLAVANVGAGFSLIESAADGTWAKRGPAGSATVAGSVSDVVAFSPESPIPFLAVAGTSGPGAVGISRNACSQDDLSAPPFHCPGSFPAPTLVPLAVGAPPATALALSVVDGGFEAALVTGEGVRRARYDVDAQTWVVVGGLVATGSSPNDIESADIDGDGDADLVTSDHIADGASVLLRGPSGFTRRTAAADCARPLDVALGDLDRDGRVDLALACLTGGVVRLYLNRGGGSFAAGPVLRGDGVDLRRVALGDLDGDRGLDVIAVASAAPGVVVFRSAPVPTAAPARVAFGERDRGTASAPRAVRIGNAGSGDARIANARIAGPGAASYAIASDGCTGASAPIGPGGSCTLALRFTPRAVGRRDATLRIALSRGDGLSIPLTGVGVRPGAPRLTAVSAGVAPRRRGARVVFALSRAAKVTVVLERRRARGGFARVARVQRQLGFGTGVVTLGPRLSAGRYRITVSAVDARGRRSPAVVAAFRQG